MNREKEYLKHLDRAFTQAPSGLTFAIEEAFARGERAVKQRHKIMTAVSVAAVLAVLCAALALAAGQLVKPRTDKVVAARGSGGVATADRETDGAKALPRAREEPTPAPRQSGGTSAQTRTAFAPMTAQRARDLVVELDHKAESAEEYWIYLSSEANGAWVFYATGYDSKKALFRGGAWYVSDEMGACLGYSDAVSDWMLLTTQEERYEEEQARGVYAREGYHIAYGPELFVSEISSGGNTRFHLWKLNEYGEPVEVEAGEKLISLHHGCGAIEGLAQRGGDYCYLREHDGQLYQISAQRVDVQAVAALPGGAKLLEALSREYSVTGCLYRSMGADTGAEIITVNLEKDGKPYHAYLFREREEDELQCNLGWEGELSAFEGEGTMMADIDLQTLPSGNLQAVYMGREQDAKGQMSIQADATVAPACYATVNGRYFHLEEHCGGMMNAYPMSQEAAWASGKEPCPVCVDESDIEPITFYATEKGNYYHLNEDCSGMLNAKPYLVQEVRASGKKPCPVCIPGEGFALCWATPQGKYFHTERECMAMRNARIYIELFCRQQGKLPCPVCWEKGD